MTSKVPLAEWDSFFKSRVDRLWKASLAVDDGQDAKDCEMRLLLDDGGYLHCRAHEGINEDGASRLAGVEETTSGIEALIKLERPRFPIVNVAECWAKKTFESPLIVHASLQRCQDILGQFKGAARRGSLDVGVLGADGTLGKPLLDFLSDAPGYNAHGFDRDDQKRLALAKLDVLFGCTGRDIFETWDKAKLLKLMRPNRKLYFVSCSSGDVEFKSVLRYKDADQPTEISNWPAPRISVLDGRGIVMRAGYPINFDNTTASVPIPYICLTTMLMAAGAFQAAILRVHNVPGGLYELSPDLQGVIARYWLDMIKGAEAAVDPVQRLVTGREPYKSFGSSSIEALVHAARECTQRLPTTRSIRRLADFQAADAACRALAMELSKFTSTISPRSLAT